MEESGDLYAMDWQKAPEIIEGAQRTPNAGETPEQQRRRDEVATAPDPEPGGTDHTVEIDPSTVHDGAEQSFRQALDLISGVTGAEDLQPDDEKMKKFRDRCGPLLQKKAGGKKHLTPELSAGLYLVEIAADAVDWKAVGKSIREALR